MLVFLLEDDKSFALVVKNALEDYFNKIQAEVEILIFSRPERLLGALNLRPDLFFTDIELSLSWANGIDIAKRVNEALPECQVVFLTEHIGYATDVYEADHLWLIIKDELHQRLPLVMRRYFSCKAESAPASIMITSSHKRKIISQSDILYCESRQRKIFIVCKNCVEDTYTSLDFIDKSLPFPPILRCHNSFIVNLDHVVTYQPNEFVMYNGDKVPISRRYKERAKNAFMSYAAAGLSLG
ncbi:MAG: response regulator transcription factor [Clostridiales bacterium]|nr:response regulator transcription factor [Clostridiales bacterium]